MIIRLCIRTALTLAAISTVTVWTLKKGRQPHLDYLCGEDRKYNVLPWDCTGYLQCSTDGREWFAHWMNCPDYLYWSQEKRTCSMDSSQCGDAREIARRECSTHPSLTFAHPRSCSKYYDCSEVNPPYGLDVFENECPYPQLYDGQEERCRPAHLVECGKRVMPVTRCGYVLECGPCEGQPNGVMPLPREPFSNYYLYCSNNKAYPPSKCPNPEAVFDPYTLKCTTKYEESVSTYCQHYPKARFASARDCAKYYDCSKSSHHPSLKTYQTECPYMMLYDSVPAECRPYDQVSCGDRREAISPCDYTFGQCLIGPTCLPCDADCKALPDGYHDYTASASPADYLECRDGRTVAVRACRDGYTLTLGQCVDSAGNTVDNNLLETWVTIDRTPWTGSVRQSSWGQNNGNTPTGTDGTVGMSVAVAGRTSVLLTGSAATRLTAATTSVPEETVTVPTTTEATTPDSRTEETTAVTTKEPSTTPTATTHITTQTTRTTHIPTTRTPTTQTPTTQTPTTQVPTTQTQSTQSTTADPATTDAFTTSTTEATTTELLLASTTQLGTTLRATSQPTARPTICPTVSPPEPITQYYCNCTAEDDNNVTARVKALEEFMLKQSKLNALAAMECKNPPTLALARIDFRHTATGAEATYTCQADHVYCGVRSVSVCPGTGQWQPLDGVCVQSVWRYPRVMFRQEFPCPFTVGTVITIHGTPTRYKKSMVHLMSGNDGALMLTICFQCGTTRDKVTFSTEVGGVSKRTIDWAHFPFHVGKEFKIVISITERIYKIDINDAPPFFYYHILPVPTVDYLVIADEITIREVRIEPSNALHSYIPDASERIVPAQTIEVMTSTFIVFKAKSCGNVQFQLATEDSTSSQGYYLRLGEDSNTMTSIRKCKLCDSLKNVWHQPLNCDMFWPFWVQWKDGVIKIGAGYIPNDNTFLEVRESEYPINYFRTVQSSTTEWIFTTPITECGPPPTMSDSRVYVRENGLVGEAVYTCDFMFTFCGQSHVSICSDAGKWEGLKGECLLSTWHWMPMPASLPFPCAFGLGSVFSVYGTPLRPRKFSISLRSGADTLLIVTAGFVLTSMSNTMLYNAQFDQMWGGQEEDVKFPFVARKEFHLTITVQKEHFKIAVDGVTIHNFAHRGDYNTLNSAYINDDVMIRKIQVYPSETASVGCQPPKAIPNGRISTMDDSVGTEAKYTCVDDYYFCGSGDMIVCSSSGQWSQVEGKCTQGSWHNVGQVPNTGYIKQYPCRYKPGLQIRIQGKILLVTTAGPLFSVQLRDGNEVIIGLNVYQTELRMNSKIPDWGEEEAVAITPLSVNTPVDLAIMINDYEYIIYSGSDELYRYKHRTPVERPHEVFILPNLDVTLLEFTVQT